MGPAERHHFPVSWRTVCFLTTVLVAVACTSAAARESAEIILSDSAPPTMNAHLAECYETLLRNIDHLCSEAKDQRNKVLTSALSKCLFGRVGLWKTEQCHHDTSPAPKFEDFIDAHGSGSPECLQLKTYKSSSVYGTVLTSLLSACALKESTQQMVEATVATAIANRSESILPAKDLEELLRLAHRVDAVYSLVLEHSSWINMIFYYSGLATLLTMITKHSSSQHYRWQLAGILVITVIAEKFLCHIVLLVVDVYSSKMVLNLVQWTVRYAGLATTAILFMRSFSLNFSFTRPSNTAVVPSARDQESGLVLSNTEQWDSGRNSEATNNFVVVRVPEAAVVSVVQLLRMFPNSAMFRDSNIGPLNHGAEPAAISAVNPAVILAPNPATVLGTNPALVLDSNPPIVLSNNPATISAGLSANMIPVNPAAIVPSNYATTCAVIVAPEDGATDSAADDCATNSVAEDSDTTLTDGSSDSQTPESPKPFEPYLSFDGYTSSLLLNRSLPDKSDEDDVDYDPPQDTTSMGSSEEDEDDAESSVAPDELDGLLSDQRDGLNETVTAETMNLSYTIGTYCRADRTIPE